MDISENYRLMMKMMRRKIKVEKVLDIEKIYSTLQVH